jgi:hypothetical protein
MSRRTTLKYTLVAVAAGTVVAASPAVAKPVNTDRVDRFGPVAQRSFPYQDYRGERALEAAQNAERDKFLPGQPTWPTHPAPVPTPAVQPASPVPASDNGIDDVWLIVGVGLAAAGIVGGSAAGVARRSRVRARRVAA